MSSQASELVQNLLNAHVAFQKQRLLNHELHEDIALHLDTALKHASNIKLNDIVSSDMVKTTIHKYAINMEAGPGIPELITQVARTLYNDPAHDQALLKDIVSDEVFSNFLEKNI